MKRFKQAKRTSNKNKQFDINSCTHHLFVLGNNSVDLNNKHTVRNLPIPLENKDDVYKDYLDNNLVSSNIKIDNLI